MFDDLLRTRRSIRKYQPVPVEREKIEILIEAALRSPSSMGRNPWEFVVVTQPDLLAKLAGAKEHGSSFLKDAPLAIVICADPAKCDVWIEDASIAALIIHLAAHDMGLGSCWIQVRDRMHNADITSREYVRRILGIPEGFEVESIIALGYPGESKLPHGEASLHYDKIHLNTFGQLYT